MSLHQFIQHEIFTRSKTTDSSRFKRATFIMEYKGKNTLGNHDGVLSVTLYEPQTNENYVSTIFNESSIKRILQSQITADKLPDFFTMPDFYHNQDDFNDDMTSLSAYIWEKNITNIEIDLTPYYDLQKCIFVHKRSADSQQASEIHILVNPRTDDNE